MSALDFDIADECEGDVSVLGEVVGVEDLDRSGRRGEVFDGLGGCGEVEWHRYVGEGGKATHDRVVGEKSGGVGQMGHLASELGASAMRLAVLHAQSEVTDDELSCFLSIENDEDGKR